MRARFVGPIAALCLASCAPAATPRLGKATQEARIAPPFEGVDYVAIGPRALLDATEPLLAHRRARGHNVERIAIEELEKSGADRERLPEAIASAIQKIASQAGERLRFVLLVGDAPAPGESDLDFEPVPTNYRDKLVYEGERFDEYVYEEADAESRVYPMRRLAPQYATDHPYALAHIDAPGRPELAAKSHPEPLAVGRIPARTALEAADFAKKVIDYETSKPEGVWRRSITLFSSPANFGALADFLIESTMTRTLDDAVPYDWDVDFVFPKLGSPYAYPFPALATRLVSRLDQGALIAGYVGHGSSVGFDDVYFKQGYYEIGGTWTVDRLHIGEGKPFFVSITCSNGRYDLPRGRRSVAEALVLNPHGAIAAFASSRESHPYPNALYGDAIVKTFVDERAPTIGEGVVTMKRRMREGEVPLAPLLFQSDPDELAAEHEGLYNLLGDPATILRYPARASVTIEGGSAALAPGAEITVTIESKEIPAGRATLTLETKRSVVRAKVPSADALLAMPEGEVWAAMQKTYEAAMDKVVARSELPVQGGRASFRMKMPAEAGEYAIKVFVAGSGEAAAGHSKVKVGPR